MLLLSCAWTDVGGPPWDEEICCKFALAIVLNVDVFFLLYYMAIYIYGCKELICLPHTPNLLKPANSQTCLGWATKHYSLCWQVQVQPS